MFAGFTLFCEHTLCGHLVHFLVCRGWVLCSKRASLLAVVTQWAAQHPYPGHRLFCSVGLTGRGGAHLRPQDWLLGAGVALQSATPAPSCWLLGTDKRPPLQIPLPPSTREYLFAFLVCKRTSLLSCAA